MSQVETITAAIAKLDRLRRIYRDKDAHMVVTMCQPAVIDLVLNRLHIAKHAALDGKCAGHQALAAANAILAADALNLA